MYVLRKETADQYFKLTSSKTHTHTVSTLVTSSPLWERCPISPGRVQCSVRLGISSVDYIQHRLSLLSTQSPLFKDAAFRKTKLGSLPCLPPTLTYREPQCPGKTSASHRPAPGLLALTLDCDTTLDSIRSLGLIRWANKGWRGV